MSQNKNPFFDASMQDFLDPQKMAERFRFPGMDPQRMMQLHQQNLEAIAEANRICFEGAQTVSQRQAEIMRESMEEAVAAIRELAESTNMQDRAAKQAELAKRSYENALANMQEINELSSKSNAEAAERVQARIRASMDEIQQAMVAMAAAFEEQGGSGAGKPKSGGAKATGSGSKGSGSKGSGSKGSGK